MAPPARDRKILLSVKDWSSEESIYTWKFLKSHLLQPAREGSWNDELLVVHIARSKEKEKERWDHGSAVIADLQTALQPYKHDVYDMEGDAGPLIADIATRESADILVLATRGRNVMKKAVLGSITDYVIQRVACPCLVVKPKIGAGDTYRMKTAAQPQASPALQSLGSLQSGRSNASAGAGAGSTTSATSPGSSSPMFGRHGSLLSAPFNRRVAIVYDTTATGRFLLKWAGEKLLEPADNTFVVRAVPKARHPSKSFADKNSVQRLASDALPTSRNLATYNVAVSQQRGNRCRSVLSFVASESVDLLVIGVYMGSNSRRKGLALRGNALTLANKCACSCLVVPMSESALVSCSEGSDLAITAEEEEELDSGSDTDTDGDEPLTPTAGGSGAAAAAAAFGEDGAGDGGADGVLLGTSPDAAQHGPGSGSFATRGASAMKQFRAPLEALFKRRGSGVPGRDGGADATSGGGALPAGLEARRAALLATLQGGGGGGGLPCGKYVVEVDAHGALKHIKAYHAHSQGGGVAPLAIPADGQQGIRVLAHADSPAAAAAAGAESDAAAGSPPGRVEEVSPGPAAAAAAAAAGEEEAAVAEAVAAAAARASSASSQQQQQPVRASAE